MTRKFIALMGLVCVAALTACDCGGSRDDCVGPDFSLTFLSPTGNTLTEFNDSDGDAGNGIQYPIRIQTNGFADGYQVTLSDGVDLSIPGNVVIDDADSLTGHIDFGEITFAEGQTQVCASRSPLCLLPSSARPSPSRSASRPVASKHPPMVRL